MSNNTRNIIYNAVKDNGVHNFPNVQNSKNLKRVKERRNIEAPPRTEPIESSWYSHGHRARARTGLTHRP